MILRHFNVVLVILFSVLFYITFAGFESYSVSPQSCSITSALKSTATQPEEDLEQILRGGSEQGDGACVLSGVPHDRV